MADQLIFDFSTSPDVSASSYLPLASHQPALEYLKYMEDLPGFRALRLVGENGSGKTHLLKAWAAVVGGDYRVSGALDRPLPTKPNPVVAVDDVDKLTPAHQEALFHLYNHLQKKNGLLVVASNKALQPDTSMLPDLRTRLLTCPQVEITAPTDADLTQLLLKWAQDAGLSLKTEVVKYIISRAERSPYKLNLFLRQLDALSLAEKRAVTLPLARKLLISHG